MNTQKIELNPTQTVLVIGGNGFIGSHVVTQLEKLGALVIIGSRCKRGNRSINCRKIPLHKLLKDEHYKNELADIDVVINTVGILRQRIGESFDQIHHLAVAELAKQCRRRNIRLVHVSALGISNPVTSQFSKSKLLGERAIKASNADWHIVKPSLVDGESGYGAKWFRRIAQWPVLIAPSNAVGKLTPIDVSDLGEIIAKIALTNKQSASNSERIYELGGSEYASTFDYLEAISQRAGKPRIKIPYWIARATSHLFDLLHLTPYSFGHYELLKFDNCPTINRADEILGRKCKQVRYNTEMPRLASSIQQKVSM